MGRRNILAREGSRAVTPEVKELLWSALIVTQHRRQVHERTLDRTFRAAAIEYAEAGIASLLPGRSLGPAAGLRVTSASATPDVQVFETEGLVGSGAASAVLAYLFHRIEGRLDGSPTLIIVDEGWLALDDPAISPAQLREWLKTLRKKNASVVFATQSLADIEGSPIAPAIVESCPTRLFLPNERALEPQITNIYRRFGLNDRQIEILARATPKRDYYCQSRRGNRLFELGLGPVALAFAAASSKSDQATITGLVAEHGRAGFAQAWLRRRGLPWAADLLEPRIDLGSSHHLTPGDRAMSFARLDPPGYGRRGRRLDLPTAQPASAQMTVFDPSNYAQNVMTAARSLQQVNNQIRSLENQATSLINQAKNLASLPYSTLVTIQNSIAQTQQLLNQAQRIAYSVTQIDQAFTPLLSAGLLRLAQQHPTDRRRPDALDQCVGGLPGRPACAGRAWWATSPPPSPRSPAWSTPAKARAARCRPPSPGTSCWR